MANLHLLTYIVNHLFVDKHMVWSQNQSAKGKISNRNFYYFPLWPWYTDIYQNLDIKFFKYRMKIVVHILENYAHQIIQDQLSTKTIKMKKSYMHWLLYTIATGFQNLFLYVTKIFEISLSIRDNRIISKNN